MTEYHDEIDAQDGKPEPPGMPEVLKVKRKYTLSEKALAARKNNAQLSTGPNSPEGKRASSKNAWKHGSYASTFILGKLGKPCKTTCDRYPCSLVDDGQVEPGQNCLDKQFVAEAFDAIIKSVELKQHSDFNELAALELAGALQILREAKEAILEDGVIVKSELFGKDGIHLGYEYKPHPAWFTYTKMLADLGITFGDFNMTPKSIAKADKGLSEADVDDVSTIMSRAFKNLAGKGKKGADED